jgi:hypothetical protein
VSLHYLCPYLLYCSLAAIILSSSVDNPVYAQDRGSQVEVIKPTKSDISPPLRRIKPHQARKTTVHEKTLHLNPNRARHGPSMTRKSAQ